MVSMMTQMMRFLRAQRVPVRRLQPNSKLNARHSASLAWEANTSLHNLRNFTTPYFLPMPTPIRQSLYAAEVIPGKMTNSRINHLNQFPPQQFLPLMDPHRRMSSLPLHEYQQVSSSQKPRSRLSVFAYLAIFLALSWGLYTFIARSAVTQMAEGPNAGTGTPDGGVIDEVENGYGTNAQPAFADLIKVADLPATFLPQTGKHRDPGRLVVVGDVHGMKNELEELLNKVAFDSKHDHLILAGDIISKGPDSPGVVDLAMKIGATVVRGNHEDRIILAHADMVAQHLPFDTPNPSEDRNRKDDALEEQSFSHGDYKDRALVKLLGEKRIKWLKSCPVILRVGNLGSMGEVVVVHAGLVPGVTLEKQDPTMVMNMRTISDNGVPSDNHDGTPWMKVWNKYQKKLPQKERSTVIFGHDSKRGLQIEKYSKGIDTGCLRGGKLTAVVIEGGHSDHSSHIVHINCKDGRGK